MGINELVMKIVKLALISIVVFALMFLIFSWMIPSNIRVSRAINIHADSAQVVQAIKELKAADSGFVYKYQVIPFDTVTTIQLYYDFRLRWYNPVDKLGSMIYDKQMGPVIDNYLLEIKHRAVK